MSQSWNKKNCQSAFVKLGDWRTGWKFSSVEIGWSWANSPTSTWLCEVNKCFIWIALALIILGCSGHPELYHFIGLYSIPLLTWMWDSCVWKAVIYYNHAFCVWVVAKKNVYCSDPKKLNSDFLGCVFLSKGECPGCSLLQLLRVNVFWEEFPDQSTVKCWDCFYGFIPTSMSASDSITVSACWDTTRDTPIWLVLMPSDS